MKPDDQRPHIGLTITNHDGQIFLGMTNHLRRSNRFVSYGIVTALTACTIPAASAHMAVEGAGELGNGALHPLITPAHVLILIALGLLLGQQVPLDLGKRLRIFAPISALALFFTTSGTVKEIYPPLLFGLALCIAILVALGRKLPRFFPEAICTLAAVGVGLDSTVETGNLGAILKTLTGTWLAVNGLVFYLAICASNGTDKQWAKVGIRVLGSWIVAISSMVMALALRK
jgi:hydrogenase/urease accessory protein HupE